MVKIRNFSKSLFAIMTACVFFTLNVISVGASSEDIVGVPYTLPEVDLERGENSYTVTIKAMPPVGGVFFQGYLDPLYCFTLAKPENLNPQIADKIESEGLGCIVSYIQDAISYRSELIIYDPAQLAGQPLTLSIFASQNVQLDGPARVLQVSYYGTLDGANYPVNTVKTTDYLYVNGEPEVAENLSATMSHFNVTDELANHVVELISSYKGYAAMRDSVYEGARQYFDDNGVVFDFEKYFEDYAKEQNIDDVAETFVTTDIDDDGEVVKTRRAFLTKDEVFVLSMEGSNCSLYSLPRPGKVLAEDEGDLDWFDLPENRTVICPEHHLYYDNSQKAFLYSVADGGSRLIINWDTFVALRKALEK